MLLKGAKGWIQWMLKEPKNHSNSQVFVVLKNLIHQYYTFYEKFLKMHKKKTKKNTLRIFCLNENKGSSSSSINFDEIRNQKNVLDFLHFKQVNTKHMHNTIALEEKNRFNVSEKNI